MIKKSCIHTRSTLSIDAIAKAAANAGANTPSRRPKLGAIAGLAGFVLRLFRQKTSRGGTPPPPPARGKCARAGDAHTRARRRGVPPAHVAPVRKGGPRHG